MEKASIILEGGATRGVFSSGALDFLMKEEMYFSYVVGVSAGSCNAVDYVSRQIGRTRDCMIHKEKENDYYFGVREFIKEKSILNMDMIFDTFPYETYPFDFETYFSSKQECELVVTNCITGKAEYLDEREDKERLMKICRASSSMPLATPIVKIDETPYLDGGLADSIPLLRAIKKAGNRKIVLILTRNKGYRKKPTSKGLADMYRRAYGKYPELVKTIIKRPQMYNRTMELVERLEEEGKIFVLRPQVKPVSRLEKSYDLLTEFYEHGYLQMEQRFEDLKAYLGD